MPGAGNSRMMFANGTELMESETRVWVHHAALDLPRRFVCGMGEQYQRSYGMTDFPDPYRVILSRADFDNMNTIVSHYLNIPMSV